MLANCYVHYVLPVHIHKSVKRNNKTQSHLGRETQANTGRTCKVIQRCKNVYDTYNIINWNCSKVHPLHIKGTIYLDYGCFIIVIIGL